MSDHRSIVQQADAALRKNRVFQDGKVQHLWDEIEWLEVSGGDDSSSDAQYTSNGGTPGIALFPGLKTTKDPVAAVLREFGLLIQDTGGPRAATIWDQKLDLPTAQDIDTARRMLTRQPEDKPAALYRDILSRYPEQGSAVPRLVFINIANALLSNNIPYRDSQGVDILTWGATTQYCSFKRYHSLIPLTSAYCPPEVHRCFGCAFARYVLDDLSCCTESSVAAALRRVILNIVSRLHPFPPLPRR